MRGRITFEKDGIVIEIIPFKTHAKADKLVNKFLSQYTIYERAERQIRAVKDNHQNVKRKK